MILFCITASCGGDFNATSGCGVNCGNHCSNYNKPNNCSSLPLFCQYNGCDCKDGYVYDDAIERCVSPNDCRKQNDYFCSQNCNIDDTTLKNQMKFINYSFIKENQVTLQTRLMNKTLLPNISLQPIIISHAVIRMQKGQSVLLHVHQRVQTQFLDPALQAAN